MTDAAATEPPSARNSFLRNVVWGWLGVGVNIVIGLLLSPIIIRKLGIDQYGVWILLFSALDYLRMLDFGFRAAVVNACARARARADWDGVNRTLVTALAYFVGTGLLCLMVAILGRDALIALLNIQSDDHAHTRTLVAIIALAVSARLVLSPLTAVLEAFQRFDLVNRAYISALVFRSAGSLLVLFLGYGLVEMALVILAAQIGENVWNLVSVSRVLPVFRVQTAFVDGERFAALFRFGRHSAVWVIANIFSLQAPMTVLGYLRGPLEVGFFALPLRLLMYTAEALIKVADVTASVTAALDESRNTEKVWRLAVMANRHCLALFMPMAVFLFVYGPQLLTVWVSPEVGERSGPLIRIMLIDFVFAAAGQYNSAAILLGQGKHARYAYAIVVEVILSTAALFLVVPRYGIMGAAWVVAIAVTLNRGVYLPALLCRLNGFRLGRYLAAIYTRPLMTAVPVLLLAQLLRDSGLAGRTWFELITAAAIVTVVYFSLALFTVATHTDRRRLLARVFRLGHA